MSNRWRRISGVLSLLVAVAVVAVGCGPGAAPATQEKAVKVGLSATFTGALAAAGAPVSNGMMDYLAYVNETLGGIEYRTATGETGRVKLDVIWEDNAYNVAKTVSIYKRQVAAGVQFMGVFGSTPGESIAALASRDRMPVVGFYASASPVNMGATPNYYVSSFPSLAETPAVMLTWISKTWTLSRPPRVGAFEIDLPSARSAKPEENLAAYARQLGMEWVGLEWLGAAPTDTSIELGRLAAKNPDFILIAHVPGGTVVIMKDALRLGLKDKVKFLVTPYGWDDGLIRVAPEAVEGLYGTIVTALPSEDVPGVRLAKQIFSQYRSGEMTRLYVEGILFSMATVHGLKQGLDTVGYDNLTAEAIKYAMQHLTGFDSQGIAPVISNVNPEYPILSPYARIAVIEGGKFKTVSEWYEYPLFK